MLARLLLGAIVITVVGGGGCRARAQVGCAIVMTAMVGEERSSGRMVEKRGQRTRTTERTDWSSHAINALENIVL